MTKTKNKILEFKKKWGITFLLLTLIILFAFFLRTFNILSIPVFADEAIYLRWSQVMRSVPSLRFLPQAGDGKEPLFMWITAILLKFFKDPLIAGRTLSAFAGIFGLTGIFLLTYRLFNSKSGALVASLFYCVSPFSMFFDRIGLVDSMLTSLGVWTLYFGVITAQTGRIDTAMIAGLFLGAALLTKSTAAFLFIILLTTILFIKIPKQTEDKILSFVKFFCLLVITFLEGFVIFNILRLGDSFEQIAIQGKKYIFPLNHIISSPFNPFIINFSDILNWTLLLIPGIILLSSLLGTIISIRKYSKELLFIVLWCAIPLFFEAEYTKNLTARYILLGIPPLFILASIPFINIKDKFLKLPKPLFLFILLLPALFIDYLLIENPEKAPLPKEERAGYLEDWTAGTGIREIAQYIENEHNQNPNEHIVVGAEGAFGTLPDGLRVYIEDIPNITVTGHDVPDLWEVSLPLIVAKRAGDKTYLVINQSRFHAAPEDVGLIVLAKYPKAIKSDGSRDYMMLYEVTDKAVQIYDENQNSLKKTPSIKSK